MKFLVVGGSGFVGRHLLSHCSMAGHSVLGTQNTAQLPDLVKFDLHTDRIVDAVGQDFFRDKAIVFTVISAAISQIDRCYRERDVTRVANVENTIRLIDDVAQMGAVPVFISSHAVFDGETGYDDEERPRNPISEYGRHKAEVEKYIEDNVPQALVLRLDKVVGDDPRDPHMFSEWFHTVEKGESITCIQGQVFAPTDVRDIARAVEISCRLRLTGTYNLAAPEFFSREELARQFIHALGTETEITSKPIDEFNFLDRRPLKSYLDSTKIVNNTNIRFTSMRKVMKSFIGKTESADRTPHGVIVSPQLSPMRANTESTVTD